MRLFGCWLFIGVIEFISACRFVRTFYEKHPNIFQLNENQTSLTIRPLYALSNHSISTHSIGIIYRLADTHLVPVPLLFQCPSSKRISSPIDCEFTLIDTRSDLSVRTTESTRTTTVPLDLQGYSSMLIRGAYFKQSYVTLRNCRFENIYSSDIFHLRIEFEQTINTPCQKTCLHPQLYHCSSISHTCQCQSNEFGIERYGQLCVDTELYSNCSLTPERCRRLCRLSGQIDYDCQCPLGTQRKLSNNMYHYCDLPILSECNDDKSSTACPNDYICREKRCIKANQSISSLTILFVSLLFTAFLTIIMLIVVLLKMRSMRCVQFVHSDESLSTVTTRLSSPCSTLSSSSKSNKQNL